MGKIEKDEDGFFDDGYMAMTGFISTSMNKSDAQKFAWSNDKTGHDATLFEIMWKNELSYYLMDMSAFPDEKEVLLTDGSKFEVISVETTQDKDGNTENFIVLKCEAYKD